MPRKDFFDFGDRVIAIGFILSGIIISIYVWVQFGFGRFYLLAMFICAVVGVIKIIQNHTKKL